MSKETNRSFERDDGPGLAFELMRSMVVNRLSQAAELQRVSPRIRLFALDRVPQINYPVATMLLTENYKLFLKGRAETIEVGIPIAEADVNYPVPVDISGANAISIKRSQGRGDMPMRPTIINAQNYDALFASDEPLVVDLEPKLLTYKLVPYTDPSAE